MSLVNRRDALKLMAAAAAAAGAGCEPRGAREASSPRAVVPPASAGTPSPAAASTAPEAASEASGIDPFVDMTTLGAPPWPTEDPFLFCVHHDDDYPRANADFGPAASLDGRQMGRDFAGKDGWRMYHGMVVPGFPQHPHRGFETVTVVRRGLLDHSDSLGAAARYGGGDVQWLTAGAGILHAEMFPLLEREARNPVELFQIWLNLPAKRKMVDPHFTMLWNEAIPRLTFEEGGKKTELAVIAGALGPATPPSPPPDSYGSMPEGDLAIWTLKMQPGASWTMPVAGAETMRSLYFFRGSAATIAGRNVPGGHRVRLRGGAPVRIDAGPDEVELLLLQGKPIGEPVAKRGPFVMNTREEIQQAYADYRRTRFGGWPWPQNDPVHGRKGRFARHADGREEAPS